MDECVPAVSETYLEQQVALAARQCLVDEAALDSLGQGLDRLFGQCSLNAVVIACLRVASASAESCLEVVKAQSVPC